MNFKYCATCLLSNVKMYELAAQYSSNSSTLGQALSRLLKNPICDKSQHVCFECARMIYKFQEFKLRCHRAQSLLSTLVGVDDPNKIKTIIENIDRKSYELTSNLTVSCINITDSISPVIKPDITKTYLKPKPITELQEAPVINESKQDNEVIMNEYFGENKDASDNDFIQSIDEYDVPIEYIFSEDSLHSDFIVSTKENKLTSKIRKEPKARKRKIKKIKTIDIENDLCDDEPLSKISKRLNRKIENAKKRYPKNFNVNFFQDFATVVFLTPEDAMKELLLRKESANYKMCPFKCEFCYKGFEAKTAYENHMKRHSVEYGEHECELCHLRYPEQKFLSKHRLACHKRKFYCKLCPYVCYCTHQAKTHVSLHKGKKYPCQECDEVFSMPNSLLMHKRLKHLTECVCELCGSTFATPRGLYSHNMKIHRQDVNGKQGPKCDDCGIHFATEMAWKKHLVLSSRHQVSNGCKHCGETFSNSEELKSHSKIHARRQSSRLDQLKFPMVCNICDKWLSDRTEYKTHMTSEHPQSDVAKKLDLEDQTPFVCEICGQMFKKHCFLTYHQRKHTGERPYKCQSCDKSFQLGGALAAHRANVHERARAHVCRLCARTFTFRSGLNKHMKAHLGIRPHKCTICEKAFISPCDRKLHIKYVHNKVPWPKRERNKRKNDDTVQYA